MKTLSLALFSLALLAPQGETTLRRKLEAGKVDTYKIESRVAQTVKGPTGDIPMTIKSTSTYLLKTVKVDEAAGTATVETTTTVDKLDADGPMGQAMAGQKPKPVTQTGKLDVRGRLTFDKSAGAGMSEFLSGAQAASSAGNFVEFPEKPVKIGDTWDIVVPKSPMLLDQDQKLTAKLVGEKDLDGVAVWVVSLTGTLKTAVDSSKLPKEAQPQDSPMGPMTILLKGEIALTGEGLVDKATGKTLSMVTKGLSKANIDLPDMGMTFDTTGTIDSTITIAKS